ncbi:MAG: Hpt domain-containing protein, partial [Acidobacteriota bacterium]
MDASDTPGSPAEGQSVSGYLAELQKEFVRELPEQLAKLRRHWRETQANLDPVPLTESDRLRKGERSESDFERLFLSLHNLHGEALSFGFERFGRSAGALAETARKLRGLKALRQDQLDALSWRLAELADLATACGESELPALSPQLDVAFEVRE